MSFNVVLYNFKKKENSTKQPTQGGVNVDVLLKENTSIYTPSFILNGIQAKNYNYLKWDSRYYYIEDVISIGYNQYRLDCRIDILATWKTDIGSGTWFKLYGTTGYDTDIPDLRLSTEKNITINSVNDRIDWGGEVYQGYCITYIGEPSLTPYTHLTDTSLVSLQKKIQESAFAELFNNPENAINKVLTNTASCITSCRFIPYIKPTGSSGNIILAGGYNTGVSGNTVSRTINGELTLNIPYNFTDFRNRSQYTSIICYLPGYGAVGINPDNILGKNSLHIKANFDSVTGDLTYYIEELKSKFDCNVGVNVQISTTTNGDMIGGFIGLGQAIGGYLSGDLISSAYGSFNSVLSLMQTTPSSVGSNGGMSSLNAQGNVVLTCITHNTTVEPSSVGDIIGRPVNKISGVTSGYNHFNNASINCNAPVTIKDEINNYLNGGFYYE